MKKRLLSLALGSAFISTASHAEIQLSGFASIVGGITTSSDETLNGYDDAFNFSQGSLLALQASSDLGDKLSATVQVMAKGSDDWEPEFSWAFLSYDVSDDLRVLAGRQRIPFYMYSDFLDVSYAFPWITAPNEVYGAPFSNFDGLGAIYSTSFGDVDASFHGMYGSNNAEIPEGRNVAKDMAGLAATFNYDWLTFRAAYFSFADTSIEGFSLKTALADPWTAVGGNGEYADVAEDIDFSGETANFSTFGFQMNFDELSLVGEYTDVDLGDALLPDSSTYYVMGSYQLLDNVLVHLTYSVKDATSTNPAADVPSGLSAEIDGLKAFTALVASNQTNKVNSVIAGVRYDFHDSAALKVEYSDFSDDKFSTNDAGLLRVAVVTIF